jgi:hypothetical protein
MYTSPVTALENVTNIINCQIAYLLTLWKHDAVLPEFLNEGCLKKDVSVPGVSITVDIHFSCDIP